MQTSTSPGTPVTPTWDDLRVLLALHRHRSFLAAGKALGVSTSTAARRIEALEAALGRPLVHRSSGGTSVEPGALELVTLAEQLERRPEEVIRHAVKGMLPRNRLARKQLTKLKVYAGPEHPHVAQKPTPMELDS